MQSKEEVSLEDLNKICLELSQNMQAPQIITLEGELGSGKTQFTNFLVKHLTGDTPTHSPTFSIINEYSGWTNPIYHIDLYRLENSKDLESTGFWDLFEEDALIIIEWSNLLDESLLPLHWPRTHVKLEHIQNNPEKRNININ